MSLYLTQLAAMGGSKLEWIQARVFSVASGDITLTYAGGQIRFAACLDSYTPVVGDYVHCLSLEGQGVLILGKSNVTGSTPAPEVPQTPVTIAPASTWTYDTVRNTWAPGSLVQGAGSVGVWFYAPGAFTSLAGKTFQFAELEVTRSTGGPLELSAHTSSVTTSALTLSPAPPILPVNPPIGVATWVPIPLGWATDLVNGTIKGFAVTANYGQTGTYIGGGRVRLTPLSVTI
jgi:hypothetical protein